MPNAPIHPASHAREAFGHTSMTSATPSAHSPPMPSAPTNRSTASCHGALATRRISPLHSEYSSTLTVIARTRPILSPSQPNSTPPVAAPTRKHGA